MRGCLLLTANDNDSNGQMGLGVGIARGASKNLGSLEEFTILVLSVFSYCEKKTLRVQIPLLYVTLESVC